MESIITIKIRDIELVDFPIDFLKEFMEINKIKEEQIEINVENDKDE
jgi:hypothetical protein